MRHTSGEVRRSSYIPALYRGQKHWMIEHTFSAHSRGTICCWLGIVHGIRHSQHDMSRRPSTFLCFDAILSWKLSEWKFCLPGTLISEQSTLGTRKEYPPTEISKLTFKLIHQSLARFINLSWPQNTSRNETISQLPS